MLQTLGAKSEKEKESTREDCRHRDEGEKLHERTRASVDEKESKQRQAAMLIRYQDYCRDNGWNILAFSYLSVCRFLCSYVAKNKGSTKSVQNVLSMLKGGCGSIQGRWLCGDEYKEVIDMVKQLEYEDHSETRRKGALRTLDLLRMAKGWKLDKRHDLQEATMYTMAQQGLLRSGEHMSGLSTRNITWTGKGHDFDLELSERKRCERDLR
jgi:hypothetical protein